MVIHLNSIPTYRAKRIDNGEYITGDLFYGKFISTSKWDSRPAVNSTDDFNFDFGSGNPSLSYDEIDPSTLAINFPGMVDKNNKFIFASLSKCGNGGDDLSEMGTLTFINGYFMAGFGVFNEFKQLKDFEVTGEALE